MSDLNPIISQAAAQNGVPEPLLRAVLQTESGMNPAMGDSRIAPAVGTERATGIAQIKPSTARGLGVDPRNPASAIGGAAKYLAQGYSQYGNWDDAARFYHGGPNQKLWGARTEDYHAKIARAAAQAPQASAPAAAPSDNPFTAAISGAPAQSSVPASTADNPFTAAINGGTQGNAASPANAGQVPADPAGAGGSAGVLGGPDGQAQSGGAGGARGVPQGSAGGPQTGPQQAPTGIQGLVSGIDAGVRGVDNGFLGGFGDKITAGINAVLPIDAITGRPVESIWNGKGFEKAYGHNLALERAASDAAMSQHPIASVGGELAGIIANPLSKLGAPVKGSSALFNMGRLSATGGTFGGAYGAGQSRASDLAGLARDTAVGAGAGAVLAPLAGAAGEKLLTPIVDAARGIGGKLAATNSAQKIGDLAEALAKRTAPKAAEDAGAVPDMFAPKTVQTGAQVADGVAYDKGPVSTDGLLTVDIGSDAPAMA